MFVFAKLKLMQSMLEHHENVQLKRDISPVRVEDVILVFFFFVFGESFYSLLFCIFVFPVWTGCFGLYYIQLIVSINSRKLQCFDTPTVQLYKFRT